MSAPAPPSAGSRRSYIVVVNRFAGRGRAHGLLARIAAALGGPAHAIVECELSPTFATRLNDAIAEAGAAPLVVCAGGDGTASLTFDALGVPAAATLALVPCGSANDLAWMLGMRSVAQALDALRSGIERPIDYGVVEKRRFINCVGIGLDAEVAAMAARIRKSGWAKGFSYYLAALRGMLMVKPLAAAIRTPEYQVELPDLVMLTVGNGSWYGGGFLGAPRAAIDDGLFDCYAIRDVKGLRARLALMRRIRAGMHASEPNVIEMRTQWIDVSFERPVAMHVDGELMPVQQAHLEIVKRGARVLVPVPPAL
ncbi:MAG: diacylglycerol kinase family lipid kinase [Candidatus Eremiobacteraeota bacterium]|nr:diacylglycerol kinase family lipid kinase [Candidatus Eremiobacteraeota bacterium]